MDLAIAGSSGRGSWLRVADMMGSRPEMAVLRRFRKLNVLRLLEMQANLRILERNYEIEYALDAKDHSPKTRSYMKNWAALDESAQGNGNTHQRDAWRKVRDALEAYSESRIRQWYYQ